jgi:hypothetical protein
MVLLFGGLYQVQGQCTGSGSGGSSVYINSVWWPTSSNVFANQTNTGSGSYTDYTGNGSKRNLKQGNVYPDNAYNFGYPWNGSNVPIYYHVYLDLNRDGDFDDTGEKITSGSSANSFAGQSSFSGRFNITAANAGTARVRFMVKYGSDITGPCETGFNGEVEDWLVTLPFINAKPVVTVPDFILSKADSSVTCTAGGDLEISISDVNTTQTQTVTVAVAGGGLASLSGTTGLSFTTGDGNADATMTFSGSLNDVNAALNGLVVDPNGVAGSHTITVSTNDGNSGTDSETFNMIVSHASVSPSIVQMGNYPVAATQDANGNTYVMEHNGTSFNVYRYPKGSLTGSMIYNANYNYNATTGEVPADIEVDLNGDVYIISHRTGGSGSAGEIVKLDASNAWSATTVASGAQYTSIAIDANNDLFACQFDVVNSEYDVVKYTGGTGSGSVIYNGLTYGSGSYPWGIDFDASNNLYVLNSFNTANGQILKLASPSYSSATVVASGGEYTGLIASGDDIYVFEKNSGGISYDVVKYTNGTGTGDVMWGKVAISGSFIPVGLGSYRGSGNIVVPDPWATNSVILLKGTAPSAPVCNLAVSIASQTNVSCMGNIDGGATLSISGGTAPLSYSWSNATSTAALTGVGAGTYKVVVTDANGCADSTTVTITQPGTSITTAITEGDTIYQCGTDSFDMTVNAVPGITYEWYKVEAPSWQTLGSDLTGGRPRVVEVGDTVYAGLLNTSTQQFEVYKLKDTVWVQVGNSFGTNSSIDFLFDIEYNQGELYFAYSDNQGNQEVRVRKYNSTTNTWDSFGGVIYQNYANYSIELEFDGANVPYVAFQPHIRPSVMGYGFYSAVIFKYNSSSTSWDLQSHLSVENQSYGYDIEFFNNELYLSYSRPSQGGMVVFKDNGTSWEAIGDTIKKPIWSTKLFQLNGDLYVSGLLPSGDSVLIYKLTGTTWTPTTFSGAKNSGNYNYVLADNQNAYLLNKSSSHYGGSIYVGDGSNWQVTPNWNPGGSGYESALYIGKNGYYITDRTYNSSWNGRIGYYALSPLTKIGDGDSLRYSGLGTYILKATTSAGCVAFDTTKVISNPAIVINITVDSNVTCNGLADGGLSANVSGGVGPYTYTWNNMDSTASIVGLSAGTYTLIITDANGCTASASETITEPAALVATAVVDSNTSCGNATDGGATAAAAGGTGPYTYMWNNSATTASITGVGAGKYWVTITDANGCTDSASVSITSSDVNNPVARAYAMVNLYLDSAGNVNLTAADVDSMSTDDCGIDSLWIDKTSFNCNDVNPTAAATSFSFNGGALPTGWTASPYSVSSTTCPGKNSPDNSDYFWATSTASSGPNVGKRFVQTNAVDVSLGGSVNFYIRYGNNEGSGCEQPDASNEEVYLQYSINGGSTWVNIYEDWNTTGTGSYAWYNWHWNEITIPQAARTTNTIFRWYQPSNSGTSYDNWGLEDVSINAVKLLGATLTVKDGAGNQHSANFEIDVHDTISPIVRAQGVTVYLDQNGEYTLAAADVDNGSTDICGIDELQLSKTDFTCADIGTHKVQFTVIDVNGNSSTDSVIVTVIDTVAPQAIGTDLTVYLDSAGQAKLDTATLLGQMGPYTLTLYTNNSNYLQINTNGLNGLSYNDLLGKYIKVGNSDYFRLNNYFNGGSAYYFYLDGSSYSPTPASYIELGSSNTYSNVYFYSQTLYKGTDACGVDSIAIAKSTFDCNDIGVQPVAISVSDASGNVASKTIQVTVADTTAPQVVAKDVVVYLNTFGVATITANDVDSATYDACGVDSLIVSQTSFTCADEGSNTVWLKAFDKAGNADSTSTEVMVVDTLKPTVATQNITVFLNGSGNARIAASDVDNGSSDNCGIDSLHISEDSFNCTNIGANTILLFVTDVNGNVDSATTTVTVVDSIRPVVVTQNATAYLDANGAVSVSATIFNNGTTDECGIDTLTLSQYDFDCSHAGANNITFTAKDVNGNTNSATVSLTVLDTISPVVVTQNVTVYLNAAGSGTITAADVDNVTADPCGISTLTLSQYAFDCSHIGANTVTLTATDSHGNNSSATATITVVDTIKPVVVTQNATVYLNGAGVASIVNSDIENGSTDACGVAASSLSQYNFNCAHLGANTVYLSVTDVNGNVDSATAVVTVMDTISPVAKVKSVTAYLDANGIATVTAADVDNGSSDNCSFSLSLSQTTFDCTETGLNLKTFTITDSSGNKDSKDAWITVKDTISPELHLRKSLTVYLDQFGSASLSATQLDSASSDNCSNLLFFTANKTSFNCTNLGANTVTVTAFDNKNNSTTGTVAVIVKDFQAPIVVTQNVTAYLNATGSVTVQPSVVNNGSADNCMIDSLWLDKSTFGCANLGQNIVKLYALDQSNNIGYANAVITVLDTISPMVSTQNITVYLNAAGSASITTADVNNGSTDNCAIASLNLNKTSFSCADVGVNTVTLTALDASSNSGSATATIMVLDTISPVAVAKNSTVALDANGVATITAADVNNGSSDACGIQSISLDKTTFNCNDLGANSVTLTITDNNNNVTTATAIITVVDNKAPVVVAQNITVYLDANGAASITTADIDNGTADNCSVQSLALDVSSFGCADLGANAVTLTATDASNNVASATAIVTVIDTISPVVAVQNLTVYLNASGSVSITTANINNGSTDNCAVQSLSLDKTNFSCADIGANTVVLTATDASANSTSATAIVTVVDTISPVVVTKNITVNLDANGVAAITTAEINNGSADACGIQSMSLDVTSFTCTDLGANTVTLTVTDNNSNVSAKTATVTVVDNVKPVVATQNITIYLDANGDANIVPADVDNNSTDNCGITNYSLDISVFDCADLGQNLVILTATDASNNSASKSAFVTVLDTIKPTIDNLPANITVYAPANQCAANVQWPAITGSDNCNMVAINTSKANGAVFPMGVTPVNVTATDGSGNVIVQTFSITVVDTVAPVVSNVPQVYTVTPNTNSCDAIVNWIEPVAIDNCGSITWTKSHIPGATFSVGTTTVTYTATDSYNNATTVSFTVVVADNIAPVISSVPANISVSADAGSCDAVVNYAMPTVTDNCTGATMVSSHPSGSIFNLGTTTVTITATDAANNVTTASFTVTVRDNEKPKITAMPASDTVGACGAAYTFAMPVATDNCSGVTVTQIAGLSSGSIFPVGVTVNAFRVSDANGNDTTVSFSVVVVPQGMPNLPTVLEICEHMPAVEMTLGQNLSWTGAGIVANGTTFDPATAKPGRHKLDYTFVDKMGCSVSGSIYITVLPQPAKPVVSKIGSTTLSTGSYVTYQWYRDGVAIPGATSQTLNYYLGGNYQVMVTNASGCDNFSEGVVIGQGKGGIGIDEEVFGNLELYPNPTNGLVTIDLNREQVESIEITVFNTAGKQVFAQTENTSAEGKTRLDLTHLPDATYMVYIKAGSEVAVKRVVLY